MTLSRVLVRALLALSVTAALVVADCDGPPPPCPTDPPSTSSAGGPPNVDGACGG